MCQEGKGKKVILGKFSYEELRDLDIALYFVVAERRSHVFKTDIRKKVSDLMKLFEENDNGN